MSSQTNEFLLANAQLGIKRLQNVTTGSDTSGLQTILKSSNSETYLDNLIAQSAAGQAQNKSDRQARTRKQVNSFASQSDTLPKKLTTSSMRLQTAQNGHWNNMASNSPLSVTTTAFVPCGAAVSQPYETATLRLIKDTDLDLNGNLRHHDREKLWPQFATFNGALNGTGESPGDSMIAQLAQVHQSAGSEDEQQRQKRRHLQLTAAPTTSLESPSLASGASSSNAPANGHQHHQIQFHLLDSNLQQMQMLTERDLDLQLDCADWASDSQGNEFCSMNKDNSPLSAPSIGLNSNELQQQHQANQMALRVEQTCFCSSSPDKQVEYEAWLVQKPAGE